MTIEVVKQLEDWLALGMEISIQGFLFTKLETNWLFVPYFIVLWNIT